MLWTYGTHSTADTEVSGHTSASLSTVQQPVGYSYIDIKMKKKYTDYLYEQWVKYILTELVVLSIVEYTAATLCRMQDSLMTLTSLLSHSSCSSSSRRRSIMLVPCTSFTVHLSINYLSRRLHCSVGFLSTDGMTKPPLFLPTERMLVVL